MDVTCLYQVNSQTQSIMLIFPQVTNLQIEQSVMQTEQHRVLYECVHTTPYLSIILQIIFTVSTKRYDFLSFGRTYIKKNSLTHARTRTHTHTHT